MGDRTRGLQNFSRVFLKGYPAGHYNSRYKIKGLTKKNKQISEQDKIDPSKMRTISLITACLCLALINTTTAQTSYNERRISIDLNDVKGILPQSSNLCVGAGRANEGLRADWQRQLKMAHDECGFKYIRFH